MEELLDLADNLDDADSPMTASTVQTIVRRHEFGTTKIHHHDSMPEYITLDELEFYTKKMETNPPS